MNSNQVFQEGQKRVDEVIEAVGTAKEYAGNVAHEVRDQAEATLVKGEQCVRNNVISGITAAFIGGIIIGFALARRERPSYRQRYMVDPVVRAQDAAVALIAPLVKAIRSQYGNARSAAHEVANRISDVDFDAEPVVRTVSEAGKRFRFWK